MRTDRYPVAAALICTLVLLLPAAAQAPQSPDWAARLIAAVMGPSPLEESLRKLTDEVGGRVPGTEGNRRGVQWAVEGLRAAGVDDVRTEKFTMPVSWSEGQTKLLILTGGATFTARAVSIAWSPAPSGPG